MVRFLLCSILFLPAFGNAMAIDMPLQGVDGSQPNLNSYQGRWVVVNYWATWCPPCIEEMPELQEFHDAHVDRDAVVLGINAELIGKRRLHNFLEDYFITYPVFMSKPSQKSELGLIPGLPTTFLVSPAGKVVARQVGPVTRPMIEQFMQKWQAQQTTSQ